MNALQGRRVRRLLLVFSVIGAIGALGVILGLVASRPPPAIATAASPRASSVSDPEPTIAEAAKAETGSDPLTLPGVAIVDFARIAAAHPRTRNQEEFAKERRAAMVASYSRETRESIAKNERAEAEITRREVFADIQRITSTFAVAHNLTLVLDRSASQTTQRSCILYSTNAIDYGRIIGALGVRDITQEILQQLAKEHSK